MVRVHWTVGQLAAQAASPISENIVFFFKEMLQGWKSLSGDVRVWSLSLWDAEHLELAFSLLSGTDTWCVSELILRLHSCQTVGDFQFPVLPRSPRSEETNAARYTAHAAPIASVNHPFLRGGTHAPSLKIWNRSAGRQDHFTGSSRACGAEQGA